MSFPRTGQVTAEYDVPVPGASIYVYNEDGTDAAVYSDAGLTLVAEQPLKTDEFGAYSYFVPSAGIYREDTWFGGKLRFKEVTAVGLDGLYPPDRAGLFFAFDAEGNPVAATGTGADAGLRTDLAADTGAALVGYTPEDGPTTRSIAKVLSDWINIRDDGAVGDGETPDQDKIASVVARVAEHGGGKIKLGHGNFLLNPAGGLGLNIPAGVSLEGDSRDGSVFTLAPGTGGHVIYLGEDITDVAIRNLTIDGNCQWPVQSQTNGHGLRVAGLERGFFENLRIRRTASYGIGWEDGRMLQVKVKSLFIEDTGADGSDFKNKASGEIAFDNGTIEPVAGTTLQGAVASGSIDHYDLTGGSFAAGTATGIIYLEDLAWDETTSLIYDFVDNEPLKVGGIQIATANGTLTRPDNFDITMEDISVKRWGWRPDLTVQAGLDFRGRAKITDVTISEPARDDCVGLRFRQGEDMNVNGVGAHGSNLKGFEIDMGSAAAGVGINSVARNVMVGFGYIKGGNNGIVADESGLNLGHVVVEGALNSGVYFKSSTIASDKSSATSVHSVNNGGNGFDIASDRVTLITCRAEGNVGRGAVVETTADFTEFRGGDYANNTGGTIIDNGTNTLIEVRGIRQQYTAAELATKITSPINGRKAFVSDASVTFTAGVGTIVAGGGTNKVPVYYDGNWRIG